jgi:hypothetical protein
MSNDVYIGKNSNGDLPSEPVLLGNKTLRMFSDLISSISSFTNEISSVTDSNGVPIAAIKSAADNLNSKLEQLLNTHLDPDNSKTFIASNQVFIS